jgi:hypothetical protein
MTLGPDDDRLAQVLPQAARAGVRDLAAARRDELLAAADALGYPLAAIDIGGCADKTALLQTLAAALEFPDWFGHNWDALADALADLGWLPEAPGYVLLLEGVAHYRAADPAGCAILLDILAEVAESWRRIEVPFWVFVVQAVAAD